MIGYRTSLVCSNIDSLVALNIATKGLFNNSYVK